MTNDPTNANDPTEPMVPTDPAAPSDAAAPGDPLDPTAAAAVATPDGEDDAADTPWYKKPITWIIAAVVVALVALGLILALSAGDDDPSSSLVTIDRVDDAGSPLETEMIGIVRATSNPESFRWLTPADGNAPEPALSRANSSGTVTFRWGPTDAVAEPQEWASTLILTESLPANTSLAAASFECSLRRGEEPDTAVTLSISVETPNDPDAASVATYTFENFEFLPADVVACGVANGPRGTTTTTTSTTATAPTTVPPTTVSETTVPETTVAPTTAPAPTPTTAPPPTTAPQTTAPPTTAPSTSIMGVLEGRADLSTLVELIDVAGLRDDLSNPGTTTLFAPDNAAFDALLASPDAPDVTDPATVEALLLAHTNLSEVLLAADVLALAEVPVENGGAQPVDAGAGTVGGAQIVDTDLTADNGVVHVLGAVMPVQP